MLNLHTFELLTFALTFQYVLTDTLRNNNSDFFNYFL